MSDLSWPLVELRTVTLDHPDARRLVAEVQQEYVHRYGATDATAVEDAEFAPPRGIFVLGYQGGAAVACGGWRRHDPGPEFAAGDAELKRMYVVATARRRGLARLVLADLERRAAAAGVRRLVLETGTAQPEAIGLYLSSGYTPIPLFGLHRDAPAARCYGKLLPVAAPRASAG